MFKGIKNHFEDLLNDEPGERFKKQFYRRHKHRDHPLINRLLYIGGGLVVVALGIIELPLPGPGTLIIILGLGLLAQESLRLSKFLDWFEVEARRFMDRINRWWKRVSPIKRIFFVMLFAIILTFIGWGGYWLASNALAH